MRKNADNIGYISLIRVIACAAVVVLHTFTLAAGTFHPEETVTLHCMTVRNACLWAVPCFVMVTGALMLDPDREMGIPKIMKRYVLRMILVLIGCTFAFQVYDSLTTGATHVTEMLKSVLYKLLTNGSWLHMWYLYLLIGIYLMLPAYRAFVRAADHREIRYTLVILALFQSIVPTVSAVTGTSIGFYICSYTVYPMYLLLGYAIHKDILCVKKSMALLLLGIGTMVVLASAWVGQHTAFSPAPALGNSYASIFVAMQAAGAFALTNLLRNRNLWKGVLWIDRCTFGVYLVHVAVLRILFQQIAWNPFEHGGLWMVGAAGVAVFVASVLLVRAFLVVQARLLQPFRRA